MSSLVNSFIGVMQNHYLSF